MSGKEVTDCAVCLGPYNDPRVLSCGHSFCLTCIQGSSKASKKSPCPVCRKSSVPKTNKISQLFKNYALTTAMDLEGQRKRIRCPECGDTVQRQRMFKCETDETLACLLCLMDGHSDHPRKSILDWRQSILREETAPLLNKLQRIANLSYELDVLAQRTRQFQDALRIINQIIESEVTTLVNQQVGQIPDLEKPSIAKELKSSEELADRLICGITEHMRVSLGSLHDCNEDLHDFLADRSFGMLFDRGDHDTTDFLPEFPGITAFLNVDGPEAQSLLETAPQLFQQPDWDWANLRANGLLNSKSGPVILFVWQECTFPVSAAHVTATTNCQHKKQEKEFIRPEIVQAYCLSVPAITL